LIALLAQELQQVRALEQAQEQVLGLQPVQEQVSALELELQPEQVLESQRVLVLVQYLHHQQLQSRFQQQRSRLLQHEFLSTLQQLAKVLLYQLCL
jgi:homoserine acetyltransferase